MSQKFAKLQNNNDASKAFGKWFATAVYDQRFVETEELANYIQQQASVKKSDIKAVLDELGGAMKHYFELGQKIRLDGIGIFMAQRGQEPLRPIGGGSSAKAVSGNITKGAGSFRLQFCDTAGTVFSVFEFTGTKVGV